MDSLDVSPNRYLVTKKESHQLTGRHGDGLMVGALENTNKKENKSKASALQLCPLERVFTYHFAT